jgi:hypothetical protein
MFCFFYFVCHEKKYHGKKHHGIQKKTKNHGIQIKKTPWHAKKKYKYHGIQKKIKIPWNTNKKNTIVFHGIFFLFCMPWCFFPWYFFYFVCHGVFLFVFHGIFFYFVCHGVFAKQKNTMDYKSKNILN